MPYCNYAFTSPQLLVSPGDAFTLLPRNCRFIEQRKLIADYFNFASPDRVVFGGGATDLLNKLILGMASRLSHVIVTPYEHNSALRPLYTLKKNGKIKLDIADPDPQGNIPVSEITRLMDRRSGLIVLSHASNVTGKVLSTGDLCDAAHQAGYLVLLDCAQSAGRIPVDTQSLGADAYVFAAHKGMAGLPGLGFALLGEGYEPEPVFTGGSGVASELEAMPTDLPMRLEPGTLNSFGIMHMAETINRMMEHDDHRQQMECRSNCCRLADELEQMPWVTLHGYSPSNLPFINLTIKGQSPEETGFILEKAFDIRARSGLHCAPLAHRLMDTFPMGTVRLSFGRFSAGEHFRQVYDAIKQFEVLAG